MTSSKHPELPSDVPGRNSNECDPMASTSRRSIPLAELGEDIGEVEFNADEVLASLAPFDAPPSEEPALTLAPRIENERQAHVLLEKRGLLARFTAIAERLQARVADDSSPERKAEYSVVASELLAMAGNASDAQHLAAQAAELEPLSRLAQTQARHLALEAGDIAAATDLASLEFESYPDADSRVQGYLWLSDFMRITVQDTSAARAALTNATRLAPRNPQVALAQLLERLASPEAIEVEWLAADPTLSDLFDSIQLLTLLRDAPAAKVAATQHGLVSLLKAASATALGDTATTAQCVAQLEQYADAEQAIWWLLAALWGADPDTLPSSISALRELRARSDNSETRLALLDRALAARDRDLANQVIAAGSTYYDAASVAGELAVGMWSDADPQLLKDKCDTLSNDARYAPLVLAARDLLQQPASHWSELPLAARQLAAWAGWVCGSAGEISAPPPLPQQLDDSDEEATALAQIIALDSASQRGDWFDLGQQLLRLDESSGPWGPSDRQTLGALFFQLAGNVELSQSAWQEVYTVQPAREAALRANLDSKSAEDKSLALESVASGLEISDERAPWLLLEAALASVANDAERAEELLQHAHVLDPSLVAPVVIGEELARSQGRPQHLVDWLERRLGLSDEAAESALFILQESLVQWQLDKSSAQATAFRAADLINDDNALQELISYLGPDAPYTNSMAGKPSQVEHWFDSAAHAAWAQDWPLAQQAAGALYVANSDSVACHWLELLPGIPNSSPQLFENLFAQARVQTDPVAQRELYERLARLDSRGGTGNTALWQNAIVERTPGHLRALRYLERSCVRDGHWQDLAVIGDKLARQLPSDEALSYCWLAVELQTYKGQLRATEALLDFAKVKDSPPPLWCLRRLYSTAESKGDWRGMQEVLEQLTEKAHYTADVAALLLRTAEVAKHLNSPALVSSTLAQVIELMPASVVAWSFLADHQLLAGQLEEAAETLEQLADACSDPHHQTRVLAKSAELWTERGKPARAEATWEQLLVVDPKNTTAIERLVQSYRDSQSLDRLAALLERQIESTESLDAKDALQVERARCLLGLGLHIAADKAVQPVLARDANHLQALQIKAEVALALDDFGESESIYRRLVDLTSEPRERAELLTRLGQLYESRPDRVEAAEDCFRRVLEATSDNTIALTAIVRLALRRQDVAEALRVQNQLVEIAREPSELKQAFLDLARIYEESAHDLRHAEEILERARRKWQSDSAVLRAFAEFYRRQSDMAAQQVLLERSNTEARRALHTGRFELGLFEVLEAVAGLRNEEQARTAIAAVLGALHGQPAALAGVGSKAFDPRHDESLAPEMMNLPLRALLQRTGWVLDRVNPFDPKNHRAMPLSQHEPKLFDRVIRLAAKFDIDDLQVWVTEEPGLACAPMQSRPPMLAVSRNLIQTSQPHVIDFLVLRALKILQSHLTGLCRTATVDLGPLLSAYLGLFLPNWQPVGVDLKKVDDYRRVLDLQWPSGSAHDMAPLAQDVVVTLGNRASQLGEAAFEWGSRTALLALGDPSVALEALAITTANNPIPAQGTAERVRWAARHAEARKILVFAVSEVYLRLRARLV